MAEYKFEKSRRSFRRNPQNAREELPKLKENLNLNIAMNETRFDDLLLDFITHHHLNIEWYQEKLDKEGSKRSFFFWLSAILLAIIPIAIFLLSKYIFKGSAITAQITTFLTGLIGFHNVAGRWFEKRNTMEIFHEAATNLKKNLFNFEKEWRNKTIKPIGATDSGASDSGVEEEVFRTSIQNSIEKACNIEEAEEGKFFQIKATYPSIDLGNILSNTGQVTGGIVQSHTRKPSEIEKELLNAERDVREKEALVNGYRALIASQEANLKEIDDEDEELKQLSINAIATNKTALLSEKVNLMRALAKMKKYQ